MDSEQRRFKKLSSAQFFATILLTFVIGLVSGFLGGISGLVALNNEEFQNSFPILKDLKIKEKVEQTLKVFTEQRSVEETSTTINAIEKVKPSVVSIIVKSSKYDFFWGEQESESAGTGFFVTNDGLIATNKHVVENSKTDKKEIIVITDEGKSFKAEIVATDPSSSNDLAFIKINDAKNSTFPVVSFANSEDSKVGQKVIAIGNALGETENSATEGIISVLGKSIVATDGKNLTESLEGVIQVSAAINPGNSGGPLIDLDGKVIGMNTAGRTDADSMNYAIPSNIIKPILEYYLENNKIDRGYLGVFAKTITKSMQAYYELEKSEGAMIISDSSYSSVSVMPGSPADKAGLKAKDIILSIDNLEIIPERPLGTVLAIVGPNKKVKIKYSRNNEIFEKDIKLDSLLEVINRKQNG